MNYIFNSKYTIYINVQWGDFTEMKLKLFSKLKWSELRSFTLMLQASDLALLVGYVAKEDYKFNF